MTARDRRLLIGAGLIPFLALSILHWSVLPALGTGDWAHYLLHAKALVEGRPYEDTGYIFTPLRALVGPQSQPPGLPLTLAPIVALGGVYSPAIRWLTVAFGVLFLASAGAALSRRGNAWCVAGALVLAGVSIESTYATSAGASDLGFSALAWMTIATIDSDRPWTRGRMFVVTALGGMAMLYRLAGVALLPALVIYAVLRRRDTQWRPLVPAAIWCGVIAGGLTIISGVRTHDALQDVAYGLHPKVMLRNLFGYRSAFFLSVLYPFSRSALNHAYHIVASLLLIVGAVPFLRDWRTSFLLVFGVVYVGMLTVSSVHEPRYAWVLFPVFAYATLQGLAWLLSRAVPRVSEVAAGRVAFAGAAALGVVTAVGVARAPVPPSFEDVPDAVALFSDVRQRAAHESMRVVFMNPRVFALETGTPSMVLFPAPRGDVLAELRRQRITHVVLGDLGTMPRAEAAFDSVVTGRPDLFHPDYSNASFRMFRLTWPDTSGVR